MNVHYIALCSLAQRPTPLTWLCVILYWIESWFLKDLCLPKPDTYCRRQCQTELARAEQEQASPPHGNRTCPTTRRDATRPVSLCAQQDSTQCTKTFPLSLLHVQLPTTTAFRHQSTRNLFRPTSLILFPLGHESHQQDVFCNSRKHTQWLQQPAKFQLGGRDD